MNKFVLVALVAFVGVVGAHKLGHKRIHHAFLQNSDEDFDGSFSGHHSEHYAGDEEFGLHHGAGNGCGYNGHQGPHHGCHGSGHHGIGHHNGYGHGGQGGYISHHGQSGHHSHNRHNGILGHSSLGHRGNNHGSNEGFRHKRRFHSKRGHVGGGGGGVVGGFAAGAVKGHSNKHANLHTVHDKQAGSHAEAHKSDSHLNQNKFDIGGSNSDQSEDDLRHKHQVLNKDKTFIRDRISGVNDEDSFHHKNSHSNSGHIRGEQSNFDRHSSGASIGNHHASHDELDAGVGSEKDFEAAGIIGGGSASF